MRQRRTEGISAPVLGVHPVPLDNSPPPAPSPSWDLNSPVPPHSIQDYALPPFSLAGLARLAGGGALLALGAYATLLWFAFIL